MPQSMEFNEWKEAAIEVVLEKQIFKSSYRNCSIKKVFLQISRNSLQKICARMKLQDSVWNFVKKRFWQRNFPVSFAKFFRTSFLQKTFGRMLLDILQNIFSTEYQIFKKCHWRSPFLVKLQAYSLQL